MELTEAVKALLLNTAKELKGSARRMFMARPVQALGLDGQSQADPQFRTTRLYTRLTATEVRRQLIAKFDYTDKELPTTETIGTKLNMLGYYPKKVAKSHPQKNSPRPTPSLPR